MPKILYNKLYLTGNLDMGETHLKKCLEIKKGQLWELWLVSPSAQTLLGAFNTLEELNQAQITLYRAWETPRYPRKPTS
jgi:hypothetical protein